MHASVLDYNVEGGSLDGEWQNLRGNEDSWDESIPQTRRTAFTPLVVACRAKVCEQQLID